MGTHFYRRTPYNPETQEQIWQTIFSDAHDAFCGCCQPLAHLLSHLIPPDHKYRHWTVDQVIKRELQENKCLFGGEEEENGGGAKGDTTEKDTQQKDKKEEEGDTREDIEELLAAAEAAERR